MAVTWTARTIGLLSSLVRTIASIIGGLILVHAVFVLFDATKTNVLVEFTAGIRDTFGWFTKGLFHPSDAKTNEAINDALAGFIWVFLGSLIAKFIARLAPASSGKDKGSKKKDDTPRSTPVQRSQPAEKPRQKAPAQEAPKQEAPQEAPKREPEPGRYPEPEADNSEAKHQARQTARDDEPAEA
jgi:zinc transporter ZupT